MEIVVVGGQDHVRTPPLHPVMLFLSIFHVFLWVSSWAWGIHAHDTQEKVVKDFFEKNGSASSNSGSTHTNNWAVLVCSSRYWFNYRVCEVLLCPYFCFDFLYSTWRTLSGCEYPSIVSGMHSISSYAR